MARILTLLIGFVTVAIAPIAQATSPDANPIACAVIILIGATLIGVGTILTHIMARREYEGRSCHVSRLPNGRWTVTSCQLDIGANPILTVRRDGETAFWHVRLREGRQLQPGMTFSVVSGIPTVEALPAHDQRAA